MLDIDAQIELSAGSWYRNGRDVAEIARDQREQIGRLWERIAPDRKVPSIVAARRFPIRLPFDSSTGAPYRRSIRV